MRPIASALHKQQEIATSEINAIKEAVEETREEIKKVKNKTAQFWTMTKIKQILFWVAVVCNIGLALYTIVGFIK